MRELGILTHQCLVSFLVEHLKRLTLLPFFSVKITLAAPKIMYLDT